jgi:hypothetical protein
MLGRYYNKQEIGEEDSQLLVNLLDRHPDAGEKIGCGVKRFFKTSADHGTECFWLEREDGTSVHFSHEPGITGKRKSH